MAIRDDIKLQVQQATNIVDLIGEQLLLKHKGREFVGLCPFHEDRNPSMYVSPAKQIFHCFVCGAGGDSFGWMMKFHKMTFPEALKFLAERAGIKVEETYDKGQQAGQNERQVIGEANGLAVMFFQKLFRHPQQGTIARAYIEKRQIPAALIESFQIGYAPDGWDGLVRQIAMNKWNQRGFELAGLISERRKESSEFRVPSSESKDKGADSRPADSPTRNFTSFYDRLRHRIIFPICDGLGRPIAFGGRKIRDEDEPKYLNSPETALFHKSRTLYGLHLAKKAIIDTRTAIIVEGYVDVIACHAMGSANVVATLGTALTSDHVKELRKYCDKVVLTFDADAAGQRAADRALEIFLGEEVDVAIAVVPEGKDPGDLMLLPDGAERWKVAIAAATDALDYQFERVRQEMDKATTMTARQRIAEDYVRKIAALDLRKTGPIRKAMVIQRLANLLRMGEEAVTGLLKKFAPVKRPVIAGAPSRPSVQGGAEGQRPPEIVRGATTSSAIGANSGVKPSAPPFRDGALASTPDNTDESAHDSPFRDDGVMEGEGPGTAEARGFPDSSSRGVTNKDGGANTTQSEKSQHLVYSDVASPDASANIGLVRAERQFMGCLLREPGLFHLTLANGRPVDETLTPGEMVTAQGRALYGVMYERLADGIELTLSRLLADLAESGQDSLAELATKIEAEVDAMTAAGPTGGSADRGLAGKLAAAAGKILDHHRKLEEASRLVDVNVVTSSDDQLRKAMESRKAGKSPLNIMRPRE